jgi:hypothetical protein
MRKNKFENPNGGFFTPMIPIFILLAIFGIVGLIYCVAQFF